MSNDLCAMSADDLKKYVRDVPDFPKQGIIFKDITTLVKDGPAFKCCIEKLADHYKDLKISKVVGVESRGFIFAGALAARLGIGMIPVRKVGKLPSLCVQESYELEYGTDSVEMHSDAVAPGERILVLDDVIATGGTLQAACRLVDTLGGEVVEVATVIELEFLEGRVRLEGRPFFSLIKY